MNSEKYIGLDVSSNHLGGSIGFQVIEHLDEPRLASFERVLFEFACPQTVVLTTPNAEYNVKFETLPAVG